MKKARKEMDDANHRPTKRAKKLPYSPRSPPMSEDEIERQFPRTTPWEDEDEEEDDDALSQDLFGPSSQPNAPLEDLMDEGPTKLDVVRRMNQEAVRTLTMITSCPSVSFDKESQAWCQLYLSRVSLEKNRSKTGKPCGRVLFQLQGIALEALDGIASKLRSLNLPIRSGSMPTATEPYVSMDAYLVPSISMDELDVLAEYVQHAHGILQSVQTGVIIRDGRLSPLRGHIGAGPDTTAVGITYCGKWFELNPKNGDAEVQLRLDSSHSQQELADRIILGLVEHLRHRASGEVVWTTL